MFILANGGTKIGITQYIKSICIYTDLGLSCFISLLHLNLFTNLIIYPNELWELNENHVIIMLKVT